MKDHIWKERKGKEIKAAVKNATLTFVKNASCNAVYIKPFPSWSIEVNGFAKNSKIDCEK